MVQVRKLVLAIAAATTLSSGLAQALELGELTLKSAANQPLVAEIELRDVAALTAPEIVPSLASPEEFARAGLDRQAFLNQLSFTPVINPSGRSVIQVTSAAPLPEPLVKFLVQVIYPSGRLLRDYNVLVDPSRFSPQAAQAAVTPAPTPAVSAPGPAAREYKTGNRDTLWEIAARYRQQASVQQTMLAIQALNPDAFQDANINRLRSGQVLRLPDASDATALPQAQAVAEVARQNAAWREGRRLGPRAQQLDATQRNGSGTAPAPAQQDNLRLVSGENAQGRGNGPASDNSKALADKLAVTQESLDSTRRENGELQSRLADLQSQLDKAQRLLQLKSDQLARLQGLAGSPDATTVQPSDNAAAPEPAPAINAELTPPPSVPATPESATAPGDAAQVTPTPSPDPTAAAPALAPDGTQEDEGNPWLVGAAAGVAVAALLLAAWLLARRRKAQQESERHARMARELAESQDMRAEDFDLPATSFEGLGTAAPSVRLSPAMVAASAAAAAAAAAPPVYERPSRPAPVSDVPSVASLVVSPAEDDPLAQAEEHMAHGRYTRAADILEVASEAEPERSDLRLKLMEAYAHQGDRDGFVAQERRLMADGANQARVEELKSRFPAMAGLAAGLSAAAVAAELDAQYVKDLLQDDAGAPEPIGDVFDTDFDLSLDGIETAPETPAPVREPAEAATPESLAAATDTPDFDTLLRESAAERASEPAPELESVQAEALTEQELPESAAPAEAEEERDPLDDFDLSLSDEQQDDQDRFASDVSDVNSQLDQLSRSLSEASASNGLHNGSGASGGLDEFDFLADSDEVTTKLDLARAYIEMADAEGARDILDEVLKEGTVAQQKEARQMLAALS
ncbi:FimV/HubP family polar landmark protein [Pseudomonas massiliensis]|uniref:FimV/HubP family polar landmark protein n=1 Tax=Pseudomonas massiliensis TaxID=522492 RepID=UPI00058BA535|nr:FimV/HubP family polar landmark protein [Pseudomonas massiliensis]